jgi:acetyltransferase
LIENRRRGRDSDRYRRRSLGARTGAGRGLGWRLMQHLIAYARAEKLKQLYGCVLAENITMLRMCREFNFSVEPEPGDATVRRVVLRLT